MANPGKRGPRRRRKASGPTGLEVKVAAYLDSLGLRYEEQYTIGRCTVDFFLPDHNTVVEAAGCYWHGCKQCGYGRKWKKRQRDFYRYRFLLLEGYDLIIAWEHEYD